MHGISSVEEVCLLRVCLLLSMFTQKLGLDKVEELRRGIRHELIVVEAGQ